MEKEQIPSNAGESEVIDNLIFGKPKSMRYRKPEERLVIPDWSPEEKGYMRRCFKFWKGVTKGEEPEIPEGISKAKADILKFKAKTAADSTKRKRRMEELVTISFKVSKEFSRELNSQAAEIDVNLSIFIRSCILLAGPQILAYPKVIGFFSDSVIPK
jgi:hypothetical protein